MKNNIVFWVKGLENYQFDTDLHEANINDNRILLHSNFRSFLLDNYNNTFEHDDACIDIIIEGYKIRFITEKLTAEQFECFVLDAPNDMTVVIAVPPKNITKAKIEVELSEQKRILIDITPIKSGNLSKLLKQNKFWSKECVIKNASEILFTSLVKSILETLLITFKNVWQALF
ncbi:MAG: hypothetical protein J1F05_08495 [Muribaculaceae bacterium]|nr:hypothetical protein [Muribaculaceae bacterium]